MSPVFELAGKYENVEFFGCDGLISGDKVTLSDVGAYEFGAFTAEYGNK